MCHRPSHYFTDKEVVNAERTSATVWQHRHRFTFTIWRLGLRCFPLSFVFPTFRFVFFGVFQVRVRAHIHFVTFDNAMRCAIAPSLNFYSMFVAARRMLVTVTVWCFSLQFFVVFISPSVWHMMMHLNHTSHM